MQREVKREVWIDDVKVTACMLVLFGHLMQSMTKTDIIPTNCLYEWFNKTVYYFHVPLFFICSGYCYQKLSIVNSVDSWSRNVLKKFLTLGIPYFTFTIATWLIKTVFSGAGNNELNGIFTTMFLQPTSPYWYLYALFFVFLITLTFKDNKTALFGGAIAVAMKTISIIGIIPKLIGGGNSVCGVNNPLKRDMVCYRNALVCV